MNDHKSAGNDEPTAPPGWYPDPGGSGNLLYWDGSKWTGDVHSAPKASSSRTRSLGRARTLVLCGGVGLALSPFLTWVNVVLLGNLSLFQLFSAAGRSNALAWAAVLGGGIAAFLAWRQNSSTAIVRAAALTVGLLGGALAIYALVGLRHDIREAHGLATIGIGPYLAVAGCVAMVVGAVMTIDRRQRPRPDQR
jgi:hypothetical protein